MACKRRNLGGAKRGRKPYGQTPAEGIIVRFILGLVDRGFTPYEIRRMLNQYGISSRYKRGWDVTVIYRMIKRYRLNRKD